MKTASMRRVFALARKEWTSWLNAPAFYGIVLFFLLFVSVWLFYLQRFFALDTASLRPFFAAFPVAYILVIPAITMRAWAEERKTGTAEILFTLPFTEGELCLGKFLGSFAVVAVMVALTLPTPLSLLPLGSFDLGVIAAEYAGTLLLGAAATSLGLFFSSLSRNQAAAFLGAALALLATMLLSELAAWADLPAGLAGLLNFVSLSFHFESFSRGLLDSRDLAFFILAAALFQGLNIRVLELRKWS